MIMKGVKWEQAAVTKYDPEANSVVTSRGETYSYDFLVVAQGNQLRFDMIEGAKEALDDPNCPVGSIYTLDSAFKTSQMREDFKGGKALFTMPVVPIKCGGAP